MFLCSRQTMLRHVSFRFLYLVTAFAAVFSCFSQVVFMQSGRSLGGTLQGPTILEANGTFYVTNTINLAPGATLTINPGARILFTGSFDLFVNDGARLIAEGTPDSRILFSRANASGYWGRVAIMGTPGSPESRISYAHFEFNTPNSNDPAIEVDSGTVALDHLTFGETTSPYLFLDGASFVVSDCVFPK